jgi:hypothetical protein
VCFNAFLAIAMIHIVPLACTGLWLQCSETDGIAVCPHWPVVLYSRL